jgi:hypothetical protein
MEVYVQLYPRDMSLEAANGSIRTAVPTLNFSARREWLVKDTPRPFTPGREPRCQLYKRLSGPKDQSGRVQ